MIKNRKKKSLRMKGDRTMYVVSDIMLLLVLLIVGYPVLFVLFASFSSVEALNTGRVLFLPVDFNLDGYQFVLDYKLVWTGFRNSVLYTLGGVSLTMVLQILCAYPLSRKEYARRKFFMKFFFFCSVISAGMIPLFLVMSKLGLVGSPLAVILCGTIGVTNVIILRTAFESVPQDLYDAAKIDGCNEFQCLYHVALPLSKATLSVLILYSMVGNWNEYFNSMIYIRKNELWPLQLVLRNILVGSAKIDVSAVGSTAMANLAKTGTEQIKYVLIVVATVPVLAAYAIVQKHFKKGVMMGSVKG